MPDSQPTPKPEILPRLSVITPSFNQGAFIGANLSSIANQGYENLEHLVIDGGSTDETLAVLKSHPANTQGHLQWVSEADNGQYNAINKGFAQSSGEVMAWLNADDAYLPGALLTVGQLFRDFPQIQWLTTSVPSAIDATGGIIKLLHVPGFTIKTFKRGDNLINAGWEGLCSIQQESTFWRRSLWEKAGGHVDEAYDFAGDYELWNRMMDHAPLYSVDVPLGCFRKQQDQKTSTDPGRYIEQARTVFERAGGHPPPRTLQRWRMRLWRSLPHDWTRRLQGRTRDKAIHHLTYDWGTDRWTDCSRRTEAE